MPGLQHVLARLDRTPMACVSKVLPCPCALVLCVALPAKPSTRPGAVRCPESLLAVKRRHPALHMPRSSPVAPSCLLQTLSPVQGSLHAALHGRAWGGEVIACVVVGSVAPSGAAEGRLAFYFRSDSAEVVAHIQVRARTLVGAAGSLPRAGWG